MEFVDAPPKTNSSNGVAASDARCKDGFKRHTYDGNDKCIRCGVDRPKLAQSQRRENAPRRGVSKKTLTKIEIQQTLALILDGSQKIAIGMTGGMESPYLVDALSTEEIQMLSDALADEVNASERVKAWMVKASATGRHGKLIMVLLLIAIPRLSRRGILPEGSNELATAAVSMATGGTSDSSGGNEQRQVDVDWGSVPPETTVSSGDTDEDGSESTRSTVSRRRGKQVTQDTVIAETRPDRTQTNEGQSSE